MTAVLAALIAAKAWLVANVAPLAANTLIAGILDFMMRLAPTKKALDLLSAIGRILHAAGDLFMNAGDFLTNTIGLPQNTTAPPATPVVQSTVVQPAAQPAPSASTPPSS